MNENSIELSPEEPRSVAHSADQNRFPDRYGCRERFCALPNLQSCRKEVADRTPPAESPTLNPRRHHLKLRTLTTDVHVDRADDSLPKELRG